MADDPDLALVRALQAGADSALNALMSRHGEPLFRFLFRSTRNETDARDLAQETFVRAYFKIGSFRPRARFATWLFQIGLNLSRDHARSKHGKRALRHDSLAAAGGLELVEPAADPGTGAEMAEKLALVQQAIDGLPHGLKAAFLLTVIEERSQKNAAEILGVTVKAVETRVYRARQLLEQAMERR